jgi:hypothetical protein
MLGRLFAICALAISLANAQATVSYNFSITSKGGCTILSSSGGKPPTPVPTRGADRTITTTVTGSAITTPSVIRVTAKTTVTVTERTSTAFSDVVSTVTVPAWTTWKRVDSVFATATWPLTVCTNGVKPKTKTVYTGTYKPMPGQATTVPKVYPTEVICSGGLTTQWIAHPIVTAGLQTVTITPTSTATAYTTTITSTWVWFTTTIYLTTLTSTATTYTVTTTNKVISTACKPTFTTTYAAKCAPTNLVSAINNRGLVSGDYADDTAVSYGRNDDNDQYHHDPSLCCQLCQDNKGCGASYWGPGPGACGILFTPANATTKGSTCGEFILNFHSQEYRAAGQGLIYQSGCGLIEYAGLSP